MYVSPRRYAGQTRPLIPCARRRTQCSHLLSARPLLSETFGPGVGCPGTYVASRPLTERARGTARHDRRGLQTVRVSCLLASDVLASDSHFQSMLHVGSMLTCAFCVVRESKVRIVYRSW